ncbi:MAG: hypothetical protein ACFFDP_00870 [Promethearchaeota archaeon]
MQSALRRFAVFLGSHILSGVLTILAMYGVANVGLVFPASFIDIMFIYSWILTLLILPIQAGVQFWSAIRLEPTPFLLLYYFQHDDTSTLPHHFLDPVRSRTGLFTVFILLLGGLIAWPIYSIYGALLLIARVGLQIFALDFLVQLVHAMAIGVSAVFVAYFLLASIAIIIVQWRRSFR